MKYFYSIQDPRGNVVKSCPIPYDTEAEAKELGNVRLNSLMPSIIQFMGRAKACRIKVVIQNKFKL